MLTVTQFWLGWLPSAGVVAELCRFRYIQPATSPLVRGGKSGLLEETRAAEGIVFEGAGANTVGFSRSSKRTGSTNGFALFAYAAQFVVPVAPVSGSRK